MPNVSLKPITSRPPVVIAALVVLAVLGFAFVNRLVTRFGEQRGALARHLYEQGLARLSAGHPDDAIQNFRAALIYSRDNFQYQLSLARALRDTGRTAESETYLISLWERSPQDGAVNLALGRLAAREGQIDKTIQYYHNAIYGVWTTDADTNRLNAWFELVETLLRLGASPQAQAELIVLSAELPRKSDRRLRTAGLFSRAGDYEDALAEYQKVLQIDRGNASALAGAGQAAFNIGRYSAARTYLEGAVRENPQDQQSATLLDLTRIVLDSDPFSPRISPVERNHRISAALKQAEKRLDECLQNSAGNSANGLASLKSQWSAMNGRPGKREAIGLKDNTEAVMDLVFAVEEQTQKDCSPPSELDRALLLVAQKHKSAER